MVHFLLFFNWLLNKKNTQYGTLGARGLSHALISLILHASYVSYILATLFVALLLTGFRLVGRPLASPSSLESMLQENLWYPVYQGGGLLNKGNESDHHAF